MRRYFILIRRQKNIIKKRRHLVGLTSLEGEKWMEFLSTWEQMYNPQFKVFESEHFKIQAGLVEFTPSESGTFEKI